MNSTRVHENGQLEKEHIEAHSLVGIIENRTLNHIQ